jgi:hypothetical protein
MKIETLKELIEIEFDRCETISQFKAEVFRLIDTYYIDITHPSTIQTDSNLTDFQKLNRKILMDNFTSK